MSSDKKLAAFAAYMSQFASHRGADMKWVMEASSHGRIFSYAWDEATKAEREACAMEADYEAARWPYAPEVREPCEEVAKAIRARGNT